MNKDTREHILEISLSLFLQKGYKAVTMQNIVTKSGLSKGAFYYYFTSKEQVFEEVVKHFYMHIFTLNYDRYSTDSLKAFCSDYLKDVNQSYLSVQKIGNRKKLVMDANHYRLIFDAFNIIPTFKQLHQKLHAEELKYWKKIVRLARERKEISTAASDEQIARMFIYLGDGFGMHIIFGSCCERKGLHLQKDIKKLWESFYSLLKA